MPSAAQIPERCTTHTDISPVSDLSEAIQVARDTLSWNKELGIATSAIAETLTYMQGYRTRSHCCKAGRYAQTLVCTAYRQLLSGE